METTTSRYPLSLTGELSAAQPRTLAGQMTHAYPPFRLDMGGNEPPTAADAVPPMPAPVRS